MVEFLDHPQTPIYLGWGSMKSKSLEHLVELCARSIHRSRQRAIVLEGDAGLSMEVLERAVPTDPQLLEFARDNILFVPAAPHEWLFPRVSVAVHHGGAGTTTAALRSGTPTVIAPVLADQFDHSRLINRLGVGFGLEPQINDLTWEELSAAITRAVTDPDVQARAAELGRQLRSEPNGSIGATAQIDAFWTEFCVSGRFWELFPPPPDGPTSSRAVTGAILVGLANVVAAFCLLRARF
jgi:sterol 3beta-glucosyltransferase